MKRRRVSDKAPRKVDGDLAIEHPSPRSRRRRLVFGVSFILAAIVWIVFGQTLGHAFVSLDDNIYVYENPHIQHGITWSAVRWAFSAGLSSHSANADYWRPLSFLSHALDIQLFGLRPGGHHLTNVIIHTAATLALFLVLHAMTGAIWRSAFVAAVFAIHPLHVESVAWITERKDVLSGLFFMLTLGAYVHYARRAFSLGRYLIVLFLFVLALMCKPMVVTLPCVLLLLDYWPLGRLNSWAQFRRLFLEKIPFFILAAALAFVTTLGPGNALKVERLPLYSRLGNALISYGGYLGQMIYPINLAVLYPRPGSNLPVWEITLAVILLALISGAAVLWRKTYPFLLVGWLWYVGMLVPVIGVVQMGVQAPADRYTYLPQIGLYLLITWAAAELCPKWRSTRVMLAVIASIMIAALTVRSEIQASYWHDSISLWSHAIDSIPNNYIAHNDLGLTLAEQGHFDEAVAHYQKALEINPNFSAAHGNLGHVLRQKGQTDDAIVHYQEALAIDPSLAEIHNYLGNIFRQKGRLDEAIAHYQKALEIKPLDVSFQSNLALLLATSPNESSRNGPQAVELAEQANRASGGDHPLILGTLAAAYAECGRFPEAVETAQKAWQAAKRRGDTKMVEAIQSDLKLFQANTPLRTRVSGDRPDNQP